MKRFCSFLLLLATLPLAAQYIPIRPRIVGFGTLAARPQRCNVGEIYYCVGSDCAAQGQTYFCGTVNAWTLSIPSGWTIDSNGNLTLPASSTVTAGIGSFSSSLAIGSTGTAGCLYLAGTDGVTESSLCATAAGTALTGTGLGYWLASGNNAATLTMAQNTTYYMGWPGSAVTTTAAVHRVYVPVAGTVKAAYGICIASNTPTTGNATLSLRLNNSTDTTITSTFAWNGSGATATWSNSALSVAVAAGDYLEIKWATPTTWATPATNPTCQGSLYVE